MDVATATWKNTIGDPEHIAVWKDPEFNPAMKPSTGFELCDGLRRGMPSAR